MDIFGDMSEEDKKRLLRAWKLTAQTIKEEGTPKEWEEDRYYMDEGMDACKEIDYGE